MIRLLAPLLLIASSTHGAALDELPLHTKGVWSLQEVENFNAIWNATPPTTALEVIAGEMGVDPLYRQDFLWLLDRPSSLREQFAKNVEWDPCNDCVTGMGSPTSAASLSWTGFGTARSSLRKASWRGTLPSCCASTPSIQWPVQRPQPRAVSCPLRAAFLLAAGMFLAADWFFTQLPKPFQLLCIAAVL